MILIALAGGTATERTEIADRLVTSGKGRLVALSQPTPGTDFNLRRAENLRYWLDAPDAQDAPPSSVEGVVVTHCLTEQEAAEVRKRGGVVWCCYSKPSSYVLIRNGDLMIAEGGAAPLHVLEPLEALSELLLARLPSPKAPLTHAAIAGLAGLAGRA